MKKRKLSLLVAVYMVIVTIVTSACGTAGENSKTVKAAAQSSQAAEPKGTVDGKSTAGEKIDPMGKYEPPIEITSVVTKEPDGKVADGITYQNNDWNKWAYEKMGIKINNLWYVPSTQADQKISLTISSGELPDIMQVNVNQFEQLIEADALADLTDVFEKYGLPEMKKGITDDGGFALKAATRNGKLLAIPQAQSNIAQAKLLWIRTDWLKNLNLPEPETMDDVLKISEAFTTKDPDKNGKNDTYGIALNKELSFWSFDLNTFFNSYHAYPGIWYRDNSGKLVYGSIQPEMKTAFLKLQEMYKTNQIDKEFGVKDFNKVTEELVAGKFGMVYGAVWFPGWPLQLTIDKDPNAMWQCYPLQSADDKPALLQANKVEITEYTVVSKKCKNPEAAIKLANLYYDIQNNKDTLTKYGDTTKKETGATYVWKWATVKVSPLKKEIYKYERMSAAMKANDGSSLTDKFEIDAYKRIRQYLDEGKKAQWSFYNQYLGDKGGPWYTINEIVNGNLLMYNEFYGAPTPTMVEKDQTLTKMMNQTFTKILMGAPVSEFDKFVENWKKLGGDAITREVNEWYEKQDK